ncbi:hypothetical protein F4604DRAFT_1881698 [Suillus subluteus]|nr:hypothetical protein F4604DRAFT_1881698 [Suillus subluteus]
MRGIDEVEQITGAQKIASFLSSFCTLACHPALLSTLEGNIFHINFLVAILDVIILTLLIKDAPCLTSPPPGQVDGDIGDARHSSVPPAPEVDAEFYGMGKNLYRNYHAGLNAPAQPCDANGLFLPPGTPPLPLTEQLPDDWSPFRNRTEFETAEFLYSRAQMSAPNINTLLDLWAASLLKHGDMPPFADHKDLYKTIDNIPIGGVNWQSFKIQYSGEKPDIPDVPSWMNQQFDVWYRDPREVARNILANPDYVNDFDYRPFHEYSVSKDERRYQDFMSGDWAWQQADMIATDPDALGATFVPIILGSDKTTVSVGTGNNEYYPLYLSIGNVRNNVHRAHRDALCLVGFLAIPKTTNEHKETEEFRDFRRQIFHSSLAKILETFKNPMSKPEIARFGDGHYRRVFYGLGPYIADYEEQVLLTSIVRNWCPRCLAPRGKLDEDALCRCEAHREALFEEETSDVLRHDFGIVGSIVPFTNDFPRADIHQLIAPDILHQIIKGCFKDHLVTWVEKYLHHVHGKREAERRMDDIDQRLTAATPFTGLRRFPQGRGFKQWTGDDSKALMKIYLPAIEGHVPTDVIRTFRAFLEFCYLVRRNVITEDTISQIEDALCRFHHYRSIFLRLGVVPTFSLPRQHSMKHYPDLIRLFGAPNGLCSSMTENKHIKAVKQPWRRSNKYNALGQMLVTNQRLDKIAALCVDFTKRGMLNGTCLSDASGCLDTSCNNPPAKPSDIIPDTAEPNADIDDNVDEGEIDDGPTEIEAHVQLARTCPTLAIELSIPNLQDLIGRFLFEQLHPRDPRDHATIPLDSFPVYDGKISVVNSASSRFYAPSDLSGIGGMRREHIRSCPKWMNAHACYDCMFINAQPDLEGMRGLQIARALCFFSFKYKFVLYECAMVHWFDVIGDAPDEDTGMWVVQPSFDGHSPNISVIHIDAIYRAAHLLPVYGVDFIPCAINFSNSLDKFRTFYVNKFADHHAFEIAF